MRKRGGKGGMRKGEEKEKEGVRGYEGTGREVRRVASQRARGTKETRGERKVASERMRGGRRREERGEEGERGRKGDFE